MIPRVIPVLLLSDGGVVKTVRFREPRYVGDPINAVRIFSDKQTDELVLLDIDAARGDRAPNLEAIEAIASEAFMPVGYGGGVRDLETATKLIQQGVEKVIVNTAAVEDAQAVARIASHLGSSTLVLSIDALARPDGTWEAVIRGGTRRTGLDVREQAERAQALGAGELIVNSVDRDGTMDGFDLELIRTVASSVDIPVVACGGAGSLGDLAQAVDAGAAAVAAGSLFVFHGRHRAVLITYPSYQVRSELFASGL